MANWTWESVLTRAAARVGIAVAVALAAVAVASPAWAGNPAADIDQCSNGKLSAPTGCAASGDWVNGNLNENNSHYREGDSVPFRTKLTDLTPGRPTASRSGTTRSRAVSTPTTTSRRTTAPSRLPTRAPGSHRASRERQGRFRPTPSLVFTNPGSSQAAGQISIWNGNVTSVVYGPAVSGSRTVVITFTATASTVVVAWGGHIGSQIDWGAGNSAGSISGSPYHMRLESCSFGCGSQDRSLKASAVLPVPPTFETETSAATVFVGGSLTDTATLGGPNGPVTGTVSFFVCGPNIASNPDCTFGGTSIGSSPLISSSVQSPAFVPQQPGRYCIRAEYAPDAFAPYSRGRAHEPDDGRPEHEGRVLRGRHPDCDADGDQARRKRQRRKRRRRRLHDVDQRVDLVPGRRGAGTSRTITAGSYSVSESGPSGYAASYSSDCAGTIAPGASKTCTVTNDDKAPKLIVIKQVVNDHGGTAVAGDFSLHVSGPNASPASFAGAATPGTNVSLNAGSYSVSEDPHAGYQGSLSADCAGTIGVGQTKTCTVTNDDVPGHLVVIKHVVNDNGGTTVAGDFTMSINGAISFPGAEAPGTTKDVAAGSYSVTESGPSGYAASYSAGCTGTIANGQTKTCTVTNDDRPASLTVVKHVVNDNGGSAVAGDFTMSINGSISFPGAEAPGTTRTVNAGQYTVTESGPSGYKASYSADCSGSLAPGEAKTCTVTNDDESAKLIVIKTVVNDDGGAALAGDFTLHVGRAIDSPGSLRRARRSTSTPAATPSRRIRTRPTRRASPPIARARSLPVRPRRAP